MLARSDLIGWSADGGKTWRRSQITGLTACTGGTADAATDPWVSAGPHGTAYFLGIQANLRGDLVNSATAIVASHSHDGGRTWSRPVTVAPFKPVNDTDAIMASPTRAGHAYAVWASWGRAEQALHQQLGPRGPPCECRQRGQLTPRSLVTVPVRGAAVSLAGVRAG